MKKLKIVDTRYSEDAVNGIKVITHLSKGMNPIACSRVFDYVRKYEGDKAVILLLDGPYMKRQMEVKTLHGNMTQTMNF